MLCYTLDKQIRRVYSSRRLERAGSRCLWASRPARHGNLFASRPDQPRSTRATRETARSERRNFFDRWRRNVPRAPHERGKGKREKMSTVIEPNAPQGSPSAFDITGAAPAAAETMGL